VVNYRARGCFVTTISPYDVEEIYELRILFELYALEKAFPRITDEDLDRLESSFLILLTEAFDWDKYHAADRDFHQLFFDKCGNRRAVTFMMMLNTQIERIRNCSDKYQARSAEERIREHLHIIKCIRDRDLEASQKSLKIHLRKVSNSAIETCRLMSTNQRES